MAFIRKFNISSFDKLSGENKELYQNLFRDIKCGEVFPAVRDGKIDFYYAGGRLFRFGGKKFMRDDNYQKYSAGTEGLTYYKKCKQENANRFSNKEREILSRLSKSTFSSASKIIVLDVEINVNEDNRKKCDMALLNTETKRLMFVEGKMLEDERMAGNPPKVIEQVNGYSRTLENYKEKIETQYKNHIEIINTLFNTSFPTCVSIVSSAKLLVYSENAENDRRKDAMTMINVQLGKHNVMWNFNGNEPALEVIWTALYK
jgi:hypothetical protein